MASNYEQAPVLKSIGKKEQPFKNWGKAIRTHELEAAIFCCLGNRDIVAIKTMLFFTGNAEDTFGVAKKTVMDRLNVSQQKYYAARKKLQDMGWIYYDEKKSVIFINYDKIYNDYKNYLKELEGFPNDSPRGEVVDDEDNLKEASGYPSNKTEGFLNENSPGARKETYNNISNNINNTIKNNKNSGACAAIAAPPPLIPGKCMDIYNDFQNGIIDKNKATTLLSDWWYDEIRKLNLNPYKLIDNGSEEYKKAKEIDFLARTLNEYFYGRIENPYI